MDTSELKLVTRVDDIGSSRSATRAGVFAVEKGISRNVSMMMTCDAFEDAAEIWKGRKDAALGFHVTLNCEWDKIKWGPVLPKEKVPSLVDERGYFLPSPADNEKRGLVLEQAMAEVAAQLARARKHGLNVEYMDEHMGIGRVGGLRDALKDFGQRQGLIVVRDVPYLGIWNPSGDIAGYWSGMIEGAPAGTMVLLSHPCYDDDEARLMSPEVAAQRDAERRALADPRLPEACRRRGAKIIRYTEMNTL